MSQNRAAALSTGWPVFAGLIALVFIPVVAGMVRLQSLAAGAAITSENARFFAQPLPVVLHILGGVTFSALGALQLWPGFRHRFRSWHRQMGWVVATAGLVAATSALWMVLTFPRPESDGVLLSFFRIIFGIGMLASITLAVRAILQRDIAAHRAWMMRGYAIGVAAGTQAIIQIPWVAFFGQPGKLPKALLLAGAWALNLAVAEWFIRKQRHVAADVAFANSRRKPLFQAGEKK